MYMKARLSRGVIAWLQDHPVQAESFAEALGRVRAKVDLGTPLKEPGFKYLCRFFRFGDGCIALFEVDSAENRIRVFECRSAKPRTA
jgi:hypothetical protein